MHWQIDDIMKITQEQQHIIDSLVCERLSSNPDNMKMVDDFYNRRNDNIANTIRNEAYSDDENNIVAYYVVKHPNGKILLFFSLKCGMLYDQFLDAKNILRYRKLVNQIEKIYQRDDLTDEEKKILEGIREKLRMQVGLSKQDISEIPKKDDVICDIEKEINDNMAHVGATFSGIELVHLCANDDAREDWESLNIGQRLGFVAFWHFIVPIVLECVRYIGCQYLFLFAADKSEDEDLVSYYRRLEFIDSTERATVKPLYDLTCKFMYQEISALKANQEKFFQNFNIAPDEV